MRALVRCGPKHHCCNQAFFYSDGDLSDEQPKRERFPVNQCGIVGQPTIHLTGRTWAAGSDEGTVATGGAAGVFLPLAAPLPFSAA